MMLNNLNYFLTLSALVFCIGVYGVLTRRNAVAVLMGIELMLNAANINLVAFNRFIPMAQNSLAGQIFAIFIITIAAAEAVVGLAVIIALYRNFRHINLDEVNFLRW